MDDKRSIDFNYYLLKGINPIVRFLIISDILIVGSAGMLGPIFALFIEDFIHGSSEAVVGTAAGIYLLTKSIFQIPIATIIDKVRGEKDDYYFMLFFSVLMSLIPLCYLFIDQPWQLYLTQFFLGLFTAMTFPSFMAIFTRHIDKSKEGTEWGVYFTLTDLASAGLATMGGILASSLGFNVLIIVVVMISLFGVAMLVPIKVFLKKNRLVIKE